MMSRHFALNSEIRAIAKRLPHAKHQLSTPGSVSNQFVTYISYILKLQDFFFFFVLFVCLFVRID